MNKVPFNKTKIVATIGPASSSHEVLRKMMIAGVDVCRLNLSHGEDSVHEGVINTIRDLNKELNLHTSILVRDQNYALVKLKGIRSFLRMVRK